MYSPKIRDDLIPRLYQLGKSANKPMTKIVDEILRDYLNCMEEDPELSENESPFMKNLGKYHKPETGEKIRTDHGLAEILKLKGYDEVVGKMEIDGVSKHDIDHFTLRAEHFLKDRNKYFECLIQYEDGESDSIDWSEYLTLKKNFG